MPDFKLNKISSVDTDSSLAEVSHGKRASPPGGVERHDSTTSSASGSGSGMETPDNQVSQLIYFARVHI